MWHRWRARRTFARLTDYSTHGLQEPFALGPEYPVWAATTINDIVASVEMLNLSQGAMLRRTAILPGGGKIRARDVIAPFGGFPTDAGNARRRILAIEDRLNWLLANGHL